MLARAQVRASAARRLGDEQSFARSAAFEILGLTWDEIDEAGGVIRLSPARSKTLVGRILPISQPIAEALARRRARRDLSVSNSLSGRHWELDQVPAVGDRTDIVQLGTGHPCVRRRRSTACGPSTTRGCVPRCRRPDARQRCLNPGFSERIGNSRRTGGFSRSHHPISFDTSRSRSVGRLRIRLRRQGDQHGGNRVVLQEVRPAFPDHSPGPL